ncbi:MAG TPA: DUF4271 domain-containing protein [Anseongella sp.]|nr:DUF4271 domain-containing protein [Anseongella sp.]
MPVHQLNMRIVPVLFLLLLALPAWSQQAAPGKFYVRPDTALQGPAPTDTSRNAVNAFIRDFFDSYPTDFEYFAIPLRARDARAVPDRDHRIRPVREAWPLLALAVLMVLTAIMARFFRKELRDLFEGFISNRLINQMVREPNLLNTPVSWLLLVLAALSVGGLLYFIIPPHLLPFSYTGPELYLTLAGLSALVYIIRICLLKITGFIFGIREFVNSYLYILYTTTGFISFLVIVFLVFKLLGPPALADMAIPAMQALFLFFFVYQYTRGVWYLVTTFQFPKIYLILYLCAFEICPLLILGMGLFNS